jgi:hypothetical protein
MTLAAVWKIKQIGGIGGSPAATFEPTHELVTIDASIQILEFCGQRNPFARRYLIQIKELRRQLALVQSSEAPPAPPLFASSSTSGTDATMVMESPNFQSLAISSEQSSQSGSAFSRTFTTPGSLSSGLTSDLNLENWPADQFGPMSAAHEGSVYGKWDQLASSLLLWRTYY